jgi:hypothetical protein
VASELLDIELGALATAIASGYEQLDGRKQHVQPQRWETIAAGFRELGRTGIESGLVVKLAQRLEFGRPGYNDLILGLAALAMMPGGVRIDEIVFCHRHHPTGYDARFRLSCPDCSPDDQRPGEGRDVVAIEGTI